MSEHNHQNPQDPSGEDQHGGVELPVVRPLSTSSFILYVLHGMGVTLGLTLLWVLEAVRNGYFRLLDWSGIKARTRRASAFPPGQPRKHSLTEASR